MTGTAITNFRLWRPRKFNASVWNLFCFACFIIFQRVYTAKLSFLAMVNIDTNLIGKIRVLTNSENTKLFDQTTRNYFCAWELSDATSVNRPTRGLTYLI